MSYHRDRGDRDCRVFVGNLPPDARQKDIEDVFSKYGKIGYIDIKTRPVRGPPFAFLDYDDPRDAEDAIRGRDGYTLDGYRLRVEAPRGGGPRGPGGSVGGGRGGREPPRGRFYRLLVTGIPLSGSWQDLKDHMREAGDVVYADVYRDGTGVVEFSKRDDMKYALKKLDDTKFKSHEGETSYIRLKEDSGGRGRDPSRSRSRSPRGRGSRTPPRRVSRSPRGRGGRGSPRYSRSPRSRSPRSRSY